MLPLENPVNSRRKYGDITWNETNGTARDRRTSKALILLSRRALAIVLLESEIKEKEQDILSLKALIARD